MNPDGNKGAGSVCAAAPVEAHRRLGSARWARSRAI
jgi:hypothetical protein